MQHLTLEALARLVDEPPEPAEAAHLRGCIPCRRELEALRDDLAALAELDDPEPPAHGWAALEAALRAEALVRETPSPVTATAERPVIALRPGRPWYLGRPVLRAAAAAAVFFLGGAVSWAVLGRGPAAGGVAVNEPAEGEPVYAVPGSRPSGVIPVSGGTDVAAPLPGEDPLLFVEESPAPAPVPGARLAASGTERRRPVVRRYEAAAPVAPTPRPASREVELDAAGVELLEAEVAYRAALQRFAQAADATRSADPRVRLAALERLVTATLAALERAPDDPVINGYHLAAVRERDEVRRRIAAEQQKNWF